MGLFIYSPLNKTFWRGYGSAALRMAGQMDGWTTDTQSPRLCVLGKHPCHRHLKRGRPPPAAPLFSPTEATIWSAEVAPPGASAGCRLSAGPQRTWPCRRAAGGNRENGGPGPQVTHPNRAPRPGPAQAWPPPGTLQGPSSYSTPGSQQRPPRCSEALIPGRNFSAATPALCSRGIRQPLSVRGRSVQNPPGAQPTGNEPSPPQICPLKSLTPAPLDPQLPLPRPPSLAVPLPPPSVLYPCGPSLTSTQCSPETEVGRSGARVPLRPRDLLLSPPGTRARAELKYLVRGVGELSSPCPPLKPSSSPSEPLQGSLLMVQTQPLGHGSHRCLAARELGRVTLEAQGPARTGSVLFFCWLNRRKNKIKPHYSLGGGPNTGPPPA